MEKIYLMVKKWRRMPSYASFLLQSAVMPDGKAMLATSATTCPHLKEVLLKAVGSQSSHFHWHGLIAKWSAAFGASQPPARRARRGGGECKGLGMKMEMLEESLPTPCSRAHTKHMQPELKRAGRKSIGEREYLSRKWRTVELKS